MRGRLRVYLGAAPGVGKTYAMLAEARRRCERGTDVVVGYVETHGRPKTEAALAGLEVVPRRKVTYRGTEFTELDTDAVLARRPEVALIDELAHTDADGGGKRWEEIERLLEAGIDVVSTMNVQHLESLNDVVEAITGVPQRETVPDDVVRRADQIELVDMAPEALRRRMAHGNVYPPEKVDAALANYFRVGNLTALRELALLWLADKVDDQLDRYRADHGIQGTWEARERVVVAITGGGEGDTLIRRAARIADRSRGADLLAVHVTRSDGLTGADPANLARQRGLVESLGGTFHQVLGDDVQAALLEFARGVNATQLVLGTSRRGPVAQLLSRGVGVETAARSGPIDVHLVTHEETRLGRRRDRLSVLSARRRALAFALAAGGLPLATFALTHLRGQLSLASDMMIYLVAVVAVALLGGLWPALFAVAAGSLLLNYYFTPPLYRFTISSPENVLALVAFLHIAVSVSAVVDLAARRTREAARASADASLLATLAGSVLGGERALDAILERLRETYTLTSVTLLERPPDSRQWQVVATVGGRPCGAPSEGDADIRVEDGLRLVLRGRPPSVADLRVLEAFAAQAAVALRQQRLEEAAEQVRPLAEADRMRTALLNAVSHDLRTPLASAKAAVESLRSQDVAWSEEDRDELVDTAAQSLTRLDRLVANLLDMSRLQAGALGLTLSPVAMEDAVPRALLSVGAADRIDLLIPADLPEVAADPGLLERVLDNLVTNALRYTPAGGRVLVAASAHGSQVELRVVDRGPGIPRAARDRVFQPFQRLGDRDNHTGVGLGLALSRGLAEAMGGAVVPAETPGGGVTMILSLPVAGDAQMDHAGETVT